MEKSFATLGLLLSLLASPASPQALSARQKALVLAHVTVIDTTGGPAQPDSTVVIHGDRIAAIGKSAKLRVPAGSQVVDATGKFLIPGLWDMDAYFYEKDYLPIFIANGITGLRVMLGYAEHHEWRKEVEAGQLLAPRMVVASRWIEGPEQVEPYFITIGNEAEARQAVIKAQRDGADFLEIGGAESLHRDTFFALTDEAKKRGIPVEGHVPVSASVQEASNAGLRSIDPLPQILDVDVEVPAACSTQQANLLQSYQQALATFYASGHSNDTLWSIPGGRTRIQTMLDSYDRQKADSTFAVLRANRTWFSPLLIAEHNFVFFDDPAVAADPRLKYMSAGERSWWSGERDRLSKTRTPEDRAILQRFYQKYSEIVDAMQRAGVELLAGTTAEEPYFAMPGFSLHDELALLVKAGLTPIEALRTATLNPARFLGRERDLGTVAAGKIADLVLLDANPVVDITNTRKISAVVYGGRLYSRAELDAMLAKLETLASKKSIGDVLQATVKDKGVDAAIQQYRDLKSAHADSYDFEDRGELSDIGNQLLHNNKIADAIRIFQLNVAAFPGYWWVYDDLGEAYMENGNKELAAENFKKSLKLDPAQTYATIKLKQLNPQ